MGKEDVVYAYNGILLSHKKEQNCALVRDVNVCKDCHIEWSESERENQVLYVNSYM